MRGLRAETGADDVWPSDLVFDVFGRGALLVTEVEFYHRWAHFAAITPTGRAVFSVHDSDKLLVQRGS